MSKPLPARVQILLRVWANKLERNLLGADEVVPLANLLRRIAAGETVDEVFGVRRPAQRPCSPQRLDRLLEMSRMRLPCELGGEGMSYGQMVSEAAKRFNKSEDTIIRDYKSREGKRVRNLMAYGPSAANRVRKPRGN